MRRSTGRRRPISVRRPEPPRAAEAVVERLETRVREAMAERHPEFWDDLSEFGQGLMAREVAGAVAVAPLEDRALAASDVIEAWLRSWVVRHAPGYERMVELAGMSAAELQERVYTIGELRGRLDLDL